MRLRHEPPAETKPRGPSPAGAAVTAGPRPLETSPSGAPSTAAAAPSVPVDPARERYRVAKAARDEALSRAVELAPKVRKELGQAWLQDCFQNRQERGKEILTAIGAATSGNLAARPGDQEYRKRGLELQKTAVEALLQAATDQPDEWKEPLTVVAVAWLKEAQVSHALDDSAGSRGWRRDRYGNFFMFDDESDMPMQRFGRMGASPIRIEDVLELRPNATWLSHVTADLQPKFTELLAQLYLKLQDESAAFPFIEQLAATHPKRAKDLAEEFVKVWTRTHNPNERREGYNPFYYYFAYEQRADRIPLTRTKQERNLVELAGHVKRLKALPIGDLNETLLTAAFTTAHSKAEVYRLEAIENVFGSVDALKPRTLAELIQQMRNLAGVWRMPDVQRQNSTNRKQRDIRGEVLHGYEVARTVTQNALKKHPDHWALLLAQAAVMHDEIDFEREAEKSSDFSQRRADALALFAKAAQSYVKAVPDTALDEQTVMPFEMWFYAALGSVDLARITADKIPDLRQPPLIREALTALPGETAERHLSQFANNLLTRASNAKPELKHRYLRAGFDVVGEHKLAREARKLLEYYGDLITEIKLETKVDGSDTVGHQKPFGVFVNLVHTKEIERESGGFGKYLQNQNNNTQMYFYNFGRPLENYRDKFRDYAQKAIGEHFEVLVGHFSRGDGQFPRASRIWLADDAVRLSLAEGQGAGSRQAAPPADGPRFSRYAEAMPLLADRIARAAFGRPVGQTPGPARQRNRRHADARRAAVEPGQAHSRNSCDGPRPRARLERAPGNQLPGISDRQGRRAQPGGAGIRQGFTRERGAFRAAMDDHDGCCERRSAPAGVSLRRSEAAAEGARLPALRRRRPEGSFGRDFAGVAVWQDAVERGVVRLCGGSLPGRSGRNHISDARALTARINLQASLCLIR